MTPYPQAQSGPKLSDLYLLWALQQKQEQNAQRKQSGGNDSVSGMLDGAAGLFGGSSGAEALGAGQTATAPFGAITTSTGLPVATAPSAEVAATPVAAEMTGMGSIGMGPLAAIAAATYMGGKAGYDMFKGRKPNPIGRGILGMATFGGSEVPGLLGYGAQKSTKEIQNDRWEDLGKDNQSARNIKSVLDKTRDTSPNYGGRVSSDSAPDFAGVDSKGQWVNNKFAKSRKVEDLLPEDVWLTQDIVRAGGNDYEAWKPEAKKELSKQALEKGMLDERKGGVYAKNDAELAKLAQEIKAMFNK